MKRSKTFVHATNQVIHYTKSKAKNISQLLVFKSQNSFESMHIAVYYKAQCMKYHFASKNMPKIALQALQRI